MGPVTLASVPRVHPEAAAQKVGGRWVAATADERLHSFEGEDGSVSAVGERVIELVDGHRTVGQIIDVLLQEFDVTRDVAEREVLDFIALLAGKQVVSL